MCVRGAFCGHSGPPPHTGRTTPPPPRRESIVIDERLAELGIELPPVFPPAGNYLSCRVDGDLGHGGGPGPGGGGPRTPGTVAGARPLGHGREAARLSRLAAPATLRADLGSLDRITRILRVFGMVN